jgi:hypothetical protein
MILTGQIFIMDKFGMIEYGVLQEGSYFGDISIIFDEPNQYSYFYDPYSVKKPLQMLSVEASTFKKLLDEFLLS